MYASLQCNFVTITLAFIIFWQQINDWLLLQDAHVELLSGLYSFKVQLQGQH